MVSLEIVVTFRAGGNMYTVAATRDRAGADIGLTICVGEAQVQAAVLTGKRQAFGSGICREFLEEYLRDLKGKESKRRRIAKFHAKAVR